MLRIVLLVLGAIVVVAVVEAVAGSWAWLALVAMIVVVVLAGLRLGVRSKAEPARRSSARRRY